jgi:hypothetical protein
MAYDDMTRCPQSEEEFQEYFFTLIGRTYGAPADGWEAVMEAAYPWNGHRLVIPPGVGPGERQYPDAPFFGLTQQYSGGPKGRIFLPTDTPDDLGYYTRCLQYLDDAAGTYAKSKKSVDATSAGLVWSWYWVAGYTYVPVTGADSPAPPDSSTDARITALEAEVVALKEVNAAMGEEMDDLVQRMTTIESVLAGGLHAHGPVNLPIVVESVTSMRAKGDIDVQVKPGQATLPPDTSSGGPSTVATVLVLRRLLDRDDEGVL